MAPSENNPLVLVHGWAGSYSSTWQAPGIDALLVDAGRIVVGIDLLGHGTADKPHDPGAYADLPGWLLDRLSHVDAPVDAIGFSLGAITLLHALVRSPERFGKVILAGIGDGVFAAPDAEGHRRIIDALEGRSHEGDAFAQAFVNHARRDGNDLAALTAVMRRPPSPRLTPDELAEVPNEVLVVIGDQDFAAPADLLATAFPNGRLEQLRNTDHFATPSSFAFIDAVLEFVGA